VDLAGRTVVIGRPGGDAGRLSRGLFNSGAEGPVPGKLLPGCGG